ITNHMGKPVEYAESEARHRSVVNTVLKVNSDNPAGLHGPEQFRKEKIHLPDEILVRLVVPEIVVKVGVLVVIAERERAVHQTYRIIREVEPFQRGVSIHKGIIFALIFLSTG